MFNAEVRGMFSRGLDYVDQFTQKAGEFEQALQNVASKVINEAMPEGLREKMHAMTGMIIKSAPHALMYVMTMSAFFPAIPAVYFAARGFKILTPIFRAVSREESQDGLKAAWNNVKGLVKANVFSEINETVRPALAVCFLAYAAFSVLSFSFVKVGVYTVGAYLIKGDAWDFSQRPHAD